MNVNFDLQAASSIQIVEGRFCRHEAAQRSFPIRAADLANCTPDDLCTQHVILALPNDQSKSQPGPILMSG